MHQLDNAHEQIKGAKEHLNNLKPEVENFSKIITNEISLKYKYKFIEINGMHLLERIGTTKFPINSPTPKRLSRLIGETIGCLRKALDYLVYELRILIRKASSRKLNLSLQTRRVTSRISGGDSEG
jgi:hypothetical protein